MVPPTIRKRLGLGALLCAAIAVLSACTDAAGSSPASTPPAAREVVALASPPASLPQTASNAEFSLTLTRKIRYVWPASGAITTYFGTGHPNGIDIALDLDADSPIRAAAAGTVLHAGGDPCCSLGISVEIEHDGGGRTRYGHLSSVSVKEGERVSQGDVLGLGGDTGESYGKHLHFELYQDGAAVDPFRFLPAGQKSVSDTERFSCAESTVRLDPDSLIELRILGRNQTGYEVKTVAYTGLGAFGRDFGILAEAAGPISVRLIVPALATAAGQTLDASLDIVMARDGAEDQVVECRLKMETRHTLPNPPGTGLHRFATSTPSPTPTRTPVLGAQPVQTQSNQPAPRASQTPVRNPTPLKPVTQ